MFESKKKLQRIEREKQELLFIKQQLEDSTPKIDISNVYVWKYYDVYSIVRLDVQPFRGINFWGKEVDAYQSTLIDIFSSRIVYQKKSMDTIQQNEWVSGTTWKDGSFAELLPLHKCDRSILAYADKKVPVYVLQQLYYRLNHVDVKPYMLKK